MVDLITISYSTTISGFVSVIFLIWYFKLRQFVRVSILRKYGDIYKIVAGKKVPFNTETFSWSDKLYTVDTEKSILDGSNRPCLYYTEDDAQPLTIVENSDKRSSRAFELVVKSTVHEKFLKSPRDKVQLVLIAGLLVGLVVVAGFSVYQISSLQGQLLSFVNQTNTLPPPTVGG
jgi:hypothetical protein